MNDDDKKYDEKFGLDMEFEEALSRYARASKEELTKLGAEESGIVVEGETQIVMFKKEEIRKIFHDGEWWFAVIDVVGAITQSSNPRRYWSDLKRKKKEKDAENLQDELYRQIGQLKVELDWLKKKSKLLS